ncbi:Trx7/PDZ domain-containing (seleno)protein [Gimesia maris]|uniref:Serine endoprotease n=2 Tax=Gimesia maris TaxID=122 RepID=A0ABX5YU04_9PLAN|nr:Trx7/PDZ domain-containing (seleno)protein [Gimesia maris]EDL57430.1 probable MucD-putative a secreted serine proteinase [Gimesia maris DSM 8797]QEG19264.1 serine endoprotease [Gimesia maris]QGQ27861.1 PDZ domain-containing protein [Gimesia maris]
MWKFFLVTAALTVQVTTVSLAQTREEKVKQDRDHVESTGYWIYNDLEQGFITAKESNKPLLVVLRCIPCEECVKLDEQLMEQDQNLKPLMDKFVRVRLISTNGLDLSLFQYDYDQSFAVFMLNPDRTVYGRFGTRSHRTMWTEDVSITGLRKAIEGALELHKNYETTKDSLAGKQGTKPLVASPEKFPLLAGKYNSRINDKQNIVKSCIHCHQIGDAQRDYYLRDQKPLPNQILFSYPHPKILGLILDPQEKATVQDVTADSIAAQAGFKAGDQVLSLEGQPLLSIADVQWVLQHAKETDQLVASVNRGGQELDLTMSLPKDWRRKDDLSWRVSSWPLRRMVLGGAVLEEATREERKQIGLTMASPDMALRIKHLGQYGAHAAAKKAGFQKGDLILSYNGRKDLKRETDLLAYGVNELKPGESVPVTVLRERKRLGLFLPRQE